MKAYEVLGKVYGAFRSEERNGKTIFLIRDKEEIGEDWYEIVKTLIVDKISESNHSWDYSYKFCRRVAGDLAGWELDTWEEYEYSDDYNEIEPDVYTSDLTEWLSDSEYHVYWLSDAIEIGVEDGFQALRIAQQEALIDIAHIMVRYLSEEDGIE